MSIRANLTLLQRLLHIRQISRPLEVALSGWRMSMSINIRAIRMAIHMAIHMTIHVAIRFAIDMNTVHTINLLFHPLLGIQTAPGPIIRQRVCIQHRPLLNIQNHRDVDIIKLHALIPVLKQMPHDSDSQSRGRGNNIIRLRILATKRDGNPALTTEHRFQRTAYRPRGQVVDGRGIAAVVRARDDEVDRRALTEQVVQT